MSICGDGLDLGPGMKRIMDECYALKEKHVKKVVI